jgi:hypothetical protein
VVGSLGSVALAFVPGIPGKAIVMLAMGAVLLPALPVILTVAEELSGPAAGTAGAIVWMAGNLGGLVVALLVQVLVHHPTAAFLAMAVVVALSTPLAMRMVSLKDFTRASGGGEGPDPERSEVIVLESVS